MELAAGDFQTDIAAAPPPPERTPPVDEDDEDEEYEEEEEEEEDDDDEETNNEDETLIAKAQGLIDKIAASPENVKPPCLHALASILETQEARYREETGHSSLSNGRASYNIGRLGNLIRDNDEFFELISAKFLSETRYPISVQAASLRLVYSCSLTWVYPHVFEEPVLENIKGWVNKGKNGQASDSEMLKTYSTGLVAACLAGGGQLVEDVLTSGLSAKLMRYLCICVLGEASTSQKESNFLLDKKNSTAVSIRSREESRGGLGHDSETSLEPFKITEDNKTHDGKTSVNDQSNPGKNEGIMLSSRGKGRVDENEHDLNSTGSGSRLCAQGQGQGSSFRDRSLTDVKKSSGTVGGDGLNVEKDDSDDCFQDCKVGSKDIFEIVKMAVRAAEAEARTANASAEAIKAAGDAAAELVKTAALEEFEKKNDEEAAVVSASGAASMVVDAAKATEVSRSCNAVLSESANSKEPERETIEETEEFFIPDYEYLVKLREKFCIQCLEILGEYIEVLGPVLHEKGVDVCLALLQRDSDLKEASEVAVLLPDVLKLICALAAHRKFAALFVDRGGIQTLLQLPRTPLTFSGLSSCLFAIGSLQGIMERVCALPSDVIHQVVALALQLLKCPQDQARKNSALFFAAAFVFRAILDAFDKQDGLKKLLNLLGEAASVRSGASSATLGPFRSDRALPEVLTSSEKQIAYHTTVALRQFFRADLLLLVDSIRSNKPRNVPSSRVAYKPLDISNEAMDAVLRQIQKDRKLGPAFAGVPWPAVETFLNCKGHITMLELCQAPPAERYLHDLLQYALGVVHIVTLAPCSRKPVVSATLSNDRSGIAVILDAANGAGFVDPEIIQPALNVLVNLVFPPPSIRYKPTMPGQGQTSTQQSEPTANQSSTGAAVGDRRISSGPGMSTELAVQMEQGYCQAREAVRAHNGIKVLLQLLQPRIITPSTALDCVRALACRVLLGLARDETIAHILTKLQVGKKLTDLVRDCGSQTQGGEQGSWRTELSQVAIELMAIVTNSARASTLAATDAAMPALRRIERSAIAAATPIAYHSSELLLLIHEHLQASGLSTTASHLLKEAQLTPLQSLAAPSSLPYQTYGKETETPSVQIQWPSGRASRGFLTTEKSKNHSSFSSKRWPLVLISPSSTKIISPKKLPIAPATSESPKVASPIIFPLKRKLTVLRDVVPSKRLNTGDLGFQSPLNTTSLLGDPPFSFRTVGVCDNNTQLNPERLTLDSIMVNYLKQQHRQCPAPITTLPPLSLLHPHVCPESKRSLDNITARLSTREFRNMYGTRRDHQLVYSRFRPWRACRYDTDVLLTCITFLGDSSKVAAGSHSGQLKVFDSNTNDMLDSSSAGHQFPLTMVKSFFSGDTQLLLSSSSHDVRLWDARLVSAGPKYSFDGIKAATFSHCGTMFSALSSQLSRRREILLYDVQTCKSYLKLTNPTSGGSSKGHAYSQLHFSPSDIMLLWNGVLWDRRVSYKVHEFDQFTDYGGGGFHPAGNQVIINSEVWDLRKYEFLHSVPSLDQTVITFNASGDVIYAILRRNLEEVTSAFQTRRVKHPLFSAFRTIDAVNYSDIATCPVDRCVLDFATEPTNSFVGLVTMDDQDEMYSSARVYEIGRRKPTDGDSDPDDADSDPDDAESDEEDEDALLENDEDGDLSNDEDSLSDLDDDDGGGDDFVMDGVEFGGGGGAGIFEILSEEGEEGDDEDEDDDDDDDDDDE
ncbi:hypothetical protein LXL04_020596 [Taraxacum kok-saghyz]